MISLEQWLPTQSSSSGSDALIAGKPDSWRGRERERREMDGETGSSVQRDRDAV